MKKVVLLLGSNVEFNRIYELLGVEFDSLNIFCNIAVIFDTEYSPIKLLNAIKNIEKEMGRERDSSVYGEYRDRIIDIDIVMYDDIIYSCERLNIPHHRHLFLRGFSRKLLREIDCVIIN